MARKNIMYTRLFFFFNLFLSFFFAHTLLTGGAFGNYVYYSHVTHTGVVDIIIIPYNLSCAIFIEWVPLSLFMLDCGFCNQSLTSRLL